MSTYNFCVFRHKQNRVVKYRISVNERFIGTPFRIVWLSCTSVRVSEQWHKKNNNGNVHVRCDVDRV